MTWNTPNPSHLTPWGIKPAKTPEVVAFADDDKMIVLRSGRPKIIDISLLVRTTDTPDLNDVLKWNGSEIVFAPEGFTFTFSIASFTATGFSTGTQLIGTGDINAIGSITFSATYSNGPATSGYVSKSGWSNLNLTGTGYVGPTTNAAAIAYPAAGASVTLTLNAGNGSVSDTDTKTATYQNVIRHDGTATASGYDQADFDGMGNSQTSGDNTQTWAAVVLAGEYFLFVVPARIGLPSNFYDNDTGFALDMNIAGAETVSITNSLGFTEDYIFVRSTNLLTMTLTPRTA